MNPLEHLAAHALPDDAPGAWIRKAIAALPRCAMCCGACDPVVDRVLGTDDVYLCDDCVRAMG